MTGIISYDNETKILIERLDRYETEVRNLENQLAALKVEKRPDHPVAKNIEAQIYGYQKKIIPAIKAKLNMLPKQEVNFGRLNRDVNSKQDLYIMLMGKLLDLEVLKGTSLGALDLKVIDTAKVYEYIHPDWPKWVINLPLGLIASLSTALFFIFFLEYLDSSFKSIRELEEKFSFHVLGAVPYIGYFRRRSILQVRDHSTNTTSEIIPVKKKLSSKRVFLFNTPYDQLANAMFVKNEIPLGKVFLITSPGPQEGKSTTSAMLMQILSRRGKKVLLMDTNFRSPVMERLFHIKAEKGLLNLLEEGVKPHEVITRVQNVDIVFTGNINGLNVDPFDILCSDQFESFLTFARSSYDFIFLDSPSIKTSKDPLALIPFVDGVVLVVEANRTQEKTIVMVKNKIEEMGGTIKGIVLNKQVNYVPTVIQDLLD